MLRAACQLLTSSRSVFASTTIMQLQQHTRHAAHSARTTAFRQVICCEAAVIHLLALMHSSLRCCRGGVCQRRGVFFCLVACVYVGTRPARLPVCYTHPAPEAAEQGRMGQWQHQRQQQHRRKPAHVSSSGQRRSCNR